MSPNKREREIARRRYEKQQAYLAQKAHKRRKRYIVAGSVVGSVVVIGVVIALVAVWMNSPSTSANPSASPSASASASADAAVPNKSIAQDRTWTGTMKLNIGDIGIQLDGKDAPQAVANFVTLAQQGFYNNTSCHRLLETGSDGTSGAHLLQCGSPDGTGTGGPGYSFGPIENAPTDNVYPAGTIAMARTSNDANSQGSQFFIVYADTTLPADSAGGYTVFGQVTSGLDSLKQVGAAGVEGGGTDGTPAKAVTIEGVTVQ